ncbi:thioredoxin family protein [Apibacter sp. HY039]|uniref:thioredoxin family protein n=1 Tax=Apibacter sp. HY039 TaxID=2501476 RepID=UPI000FEB9BE0|nr:thioredoxin family protein [Apibacter sp. HY039]
MENTIDLHYFWNQSVTYQEYKELITQQEEQDKNSEDEEKRKLADYIHLNLSRIHRNDKTIKLDEATVAGLKSISKKINILVISEGWCGDAAQSVPVVNKLAESSDKIELKIFFRDKDERLINQYLTRGGKAIPIVIILDQDFKEIAHWGPRPKPLQPFLDKYKAQPETYTHDDFAKDLQNFYNTDKGQTISHEILHLIQGL